MKLFKRVLSTILCAVICFTLNFVAFAEPVSPVITVSSTEAMPGDTVTVSISIDKNPGIMAMAFCITYDNTSLTYKNYSKGYLSSYTVKDHSDKGHVSFVNVENKDNSTNGTIISLTFDVKENAKPGKSVITLANSNRDQHGTKLHNSFSNSKQEFVVPVVATGGVTIAETCENAGHKYSEWEIVRENSCTEDGLKSHVCSRCNKFEEAVIPAAHSFEADWTIDKAATPEEDGIMSRHCTVCDAKTDEFTFKYEEIGGEDETPDDTTSSENSSTESEPASSNEQNSSSEISSESSASKPNIDNVVGEKVPQQEAEKFEEYVPPKAEDETSSEETDNIISSETVSTESEPISSDTTIGATEENTVKQEKDPSFFATPIGIIVIIIGSLVSIGILALGVIIILRKQKEQQ